MRSARVRLLIFGAADTNRTPFRVALRKLPFPSPAQLASIHSTHFYRTLVLDQPLLPRSARRIYLPLPPAQEIRDLAPGSAFEVTAQTESTLQRRQSSVYGEVQERLIEAVPPVLARVTASPPDATTTELLLEYEVLGTTGTLHYALSEAEAAAQGGKVNKRPELISVCWDGWGRASAYQYTTVTPWNESVSGWTYAANI